MRKESNVTKNEKGFTLIELLVVMFIMTFITISVSTVMMTAVKVMMQGGRQSVAQSSVEHVINKIAEDIRQAGKDDLRHIFTGSNGTSIIFTRYQQNLDAFGGTGDLNFDDACYSFTPPVGSDPYKDSYQLGRIMGGSGSGDPTNRGCANVYTISDTSADVRSFRIEYCRPDADSDGDYACTSNPIDNSGLDVVEPNLPDYTDTAACVWMVKISATYSRRYLKKSGVMDSGYYVSSANSYQTAVTLRNPHLMSLFHDDDKDNYVDCCDTDFRTDISADIDWCPPPRSM